MSGFQPHNVRSNQVWTKMERGEEDSRREVQDERNPGAGSGELGKRRGRGKVRSDPRTG